MLSIIFSIISTWLVIGGVLVIFYEVYSLLRYGPCPYDTDTTKAIVLAIVGWPLFAYWLYVEGLR